MLARDDLFPVEARIFAASIREVVPRTAEEAIRSLSTTDQLIVPVPSDQDLDHRVALARRVPSAGNERPILRSPRERRDTTGSQQGR